MNNKEAAKALIDGEKVVDCAWIGEAYVYLGKDCLIKISEDAPYRFDNFTLTKFINDNLVLDWEIYKEPEPPKKRKLYAHNDESKIVFMTFENPQPYFKRLPEFDLEFPEVVK